MSVHTNTHDKSTCLHAFKWKIVNIAVELCPELLKVNDKIKAL